MSELTDQANKVMLGKATTAKITSISDCRICRGFSKTKCWFCGKKRPPKRELTAIQRIIVDRVEELEKWCEATLAGTKKYDMVTTGCLSLDNMIRRQFRIPELNK